MTGRGTANIAIKQLGGCIVLAYSVIAWGILCSRREDSGVPV